MTVLVVLVLVLLGAYAVASANRFVRQQALVAESEAQVEVELRRRQDLVPALVEAVRVHETHEGDLLRELLEAQRQAAALGTAPAEERLTRALGALPAPATAPVERLQAELAETEDRIAAARRFHAGAVRALQVRREAFPSALVARALGVEAPERAELDDRARAELELPPGP